MIYVQATKKDLLQDSKKLRPVKLLCPNMQAILYSQRWMDYTREKIKNKKEREHLIGYIDRNRDCIPCYALRKKLGLRVSSNPIEKANDLVVSNRQKHNGMSWSADGSTSLATLTSVRRNSDHMNWIPYPFLRVGKEEERRVKRSLKRTSMW
jgi:hypothetical protein